MALGRRSGSVVCPSCGQLVGASERKCSNCGRPLPAMFGLTPIIRELGREISFGDLVLGLCVIVYLATLGMDPGGIGMTGFLDFLSPSSDSLRRFGASGILPVLHDGRWWTVISASWLHGSLIHIGFNMLWVRQLAPVMEHLYGTGRSLMIYILGGIAGFLLSTFHVFLPDILDFVLGTGGFTVGASASLFAIFGALVHYSRSSGNRMLGQQVWGYVIFLGVFGLIFRGIDNWAHLGGFLGGWVAARWLDPNRPERVDHLFGALALLVLSIGAIVASLLVPIPPWPGY